MQCENETINEPTSIMVVDSISKAIRAICKRSTSQHGKQLNHLAQPSLERRTQFLHASCTASNRLVDFPNFLMVDALMSAKLKTPSAEKIKQKILNRRSSRSACRVGTRTHVNRVSSAIAGNRKSHLSNGLVASRQLGRRDVPVCTGVLLATPLRLGSVHQLRGSFHQVMEVETSAWWHGLHVLELGLCRTALISFWVKANTTK